MLLSNPATFDQRPLKEAHTLANAGRDVVILAWDRELETQSDSVFDDGLVIRRLRLGAGHGTPFLTVPKLLLFYLWCLAHLVFYRADAIHCHDVDTLPAGFAAKAVKLNRPRLVYDMHDLPEAFLRFFPLTSLTQAVFLASARRLADAIVVVNDRFVTYLGSLGFDKSKLVVVMNSPPVAGGRRRKRRGEEFNVLYYGWLGEERGVRLLVEAMKGLGGTRLTLAGRGELESWVKDEVAKNPSMRFLGWLKMKDLELVIQGADLIPSLYEPRTRNAMIATPGKLLTAMSLSIPSLVPSGTYQAEIVEKYGCGVVVDWKDQADVRRAIQRLATDSEFYDRLAEASYEAFVSNFSWEVMQRRLADAYTGLLSPS
ncbi:MAG: glycosyltransferase family 4 protein [Thaumarchaeota archaeon]|nr:glycosyltransferase family 4 protein [Nitrososphaerota archaeon]